jgi:hypothetical protein
LLVNDCLVNGCLIKDCLADESILVDESIAFIRCYLSIVF